MDLSFLRERAAKMPVTGFPEYKDTLIHEINNDDLLAMLEKIETEWRYNRVSPHKLTFYSNACLYLGIDDVINKK